MGDLKNRQILMLMLLAFLVSLVPLTLVSMPPIADLPNHLARIHILRTAGADPVLNQYYVVAWGILPNLVMDWLLVALDWIPLMAAGSFSVALTFLLILTGVLLLQHTLLGRLSVIALFAVLLLYNRMLLWGMVNYLMGVGVLLIAFALWVRMRDDAPTKRIVVSSLMALAVFFCHLFPFGIYALSVGAFELQSLLKKENRNFKTWRHTIFIGGVQFILPVIAFIFLSPTSGYAQTRLAFGDFSRKLVTVPFMTFNNYNLLLDLASLALVSALVGFLLLRSIIKIRQEMWGVIGLLSAVHFLMPQYLMSSPGADLRTFFPLLFIAIAAVELKKGSKMAINIAIGVFGLLFVGRTLVVADHWQRADTEILPEYRELIASLPVGARVGTYFYLSDNKWFVDPPHQHYVTLAIVEKSAFVPSLFAHPGQQPVHYTPSAQKTAVIAPSIMVSPSLQQQDVPASSKTSNFWFCRFENIDFLMLSNAPKKSLDLPEFLVPTLQRKHVSLFRVARPLLAEYDLATCPD